MDQNQFSKRVITFTIYVLVLLACIAMLIFLYRSVMAIIKSNETVVETIKVTVLSADITTQNEGSFTLGRGELESKTYYVVYEQTEDNGLLFVKYPCENTVFYTELPADATAYAEKDMNKYGEVLACRLYLPEGSVVHTYDLSLPG